MMKMKKMTSFLLAAVTASALLFAGCSGKTGNEQQDISSGAQTETSAPAEAAQDETVETLKVAMLGKDIKTACVILAQRLGYFEEEGVNVEFEQVSSLPEALTAVSKGQLDVLPYGAIPSCSFISQGTDVVIFGGTISEGSEAITLPEHAQDYTTAEDFRGKKIGCFRMETGHMVMKGYLREAGLDLNEDVEFIYLDSQASIMEAVSKGEVDLGFVNSGYGYICKQGGLSVAFQAGDFVEDFPCCRQTTSRASLENKKDALVKFETALLRACAVYQNDPDTTVKELQAYCGMDEDYVRAILYGSEDYDNAMIISLDPNKDKMEDFYEVMKANGDIDAGTTYEIADYIDTDVYYTALETVMERGENTQMYQELMDAFESSNR